MGFNHWTNPKAVDVMLDRCSAGHAVPSRAWNGNVHRRAEVAHCRAHILESMLYQTLFLDYTKQFQGTMLVCIRTSKPAMGQKGYQGRLGSQFNDVKCRNDADTDRYLVVSEHVCIYIACLCCPAV